MSPFDARGGDGVSILDPTEQAQGFRRLREDWRMTPSLMELFAASNGEPVEWDGMLVHRAYVMTVERGEEFELQIVKAKGAPVQGFYVRIDSGDVEVALQTAGVAVFWADAAASRFRLRAAPQSPTSALRIWNAWRSVTNAPASGVGNSGIVVADDADRVELRCSDGEGEPTFDDLVIRIRSLGVVPSVQGFTSSTR